jgi:hypothetical protein
MHVEAIAAGTLGAAEGALVAMANLRQHRTGVPGTIYIPAARPAHGPRVKHLAGRPGANVPRRAVSVGQDPTVMDATRPPSALGAPPL